MDEKAVAGLRLYADLWPGRVRCIFRAGPKSSIAFGGAYDPNDLPFEVKLVPDGTQVSDADLSDASVVLASGDNWLDFPIAEQGKRLGFRVCFVIEYTLSTRATIAFLSKMSIFKKIRSLVWLLHKEMQRRAAFKKAMFLQSNGIPAAESYGECCRSVLTFFDTRLSRAQMATSKDVRSKVRRLQSGAPLRLVYTGRLERMKGAEHLVEVARQLQIPFTLDIYGDGTLRTEMQDAIRRWSLNDRVRIHQPIDFSTALIPMLRTEADLFLCCHVQSDPSCTYLETLGCGVPIVGYANRAWKGLLSKADAGWSVQLRRPALMAKKVEELHGSRDELCSKIDGAISFARKHSFEDEFRRRVEHLVQLSAEEDTFLQARD
ncbi:MAG: glycosyltransferase [Bradyrhizobium sp.]|nr:glycosyltransferase [Bradyrhizobium sp.]